jgi:hypothetical protein
MGEIRNPKLRTFEICDLGFEFVSDFDIRISNLTTYVSTTAPKKT